VTERCVFRLTGAGLELVEVAPGIDIDRDILSHMPFRPVVEAPRQMDAGLFRAAPLGLRERMLDIRIEDRISYDAATNTLFLNYAGMRVRTQDDLDKIKHAVEATLEPLGKRVNSIVNYDSFSADDDVIDRYLDLVRHVEKTYYLKVSRYTTSGFMRLKLGEELAKREVSSHVFETRREARRHLDQA
jgi:propionate CoA-transferase